MLAKTGSVTGSYATCMKIWKDRNSEPYVHFIHMFMGIGMLVSPAIGAQLLPRKDGSVVWDLLPGVATPIQSYFLLMGVISLLMAPAHLYFGMTDYRRAVKNKKAQGISKPELEIKPLPLKMLMVTFGLLFFL